MTPSKVFQQPDTGTHRLPAFAKALDSTAFALLLTAVVWAPWPLGSNRPWALAILATLLWAGLTLAALARLAPDCAAVRASALPATAWVPIAALSGFAGLLVAQLVPGLGTGGGTVSIDTFATQHYLFTTGVYGGAWALVLLTTVSQERAGRLLGAVVAAGVCQATVAVVLYSTNWRYELWFAAFEQGGRSTGTFVNPDHLAGYMELTLSAGLGWLLAQFNPQSGMRSANWQAGLSAMLGFLLSPKMLLRLLLVVAVIALVMTHSRMGNGAFFIALFVVGAVVAWRSQRLRRPALWVVVSMAVVDVFIIGQWVGLDRVVKRIKDTAEASISSPSAPDSTAAFGSAAPTQRPPSEQSLQERLEVPLLSLKLVAAKPWLGHGGGTYVTAFPPYKVDGLPLLWDQAHNDFVQVASDTGLLGLALWLTTGLASAWRALRLIDDHQSAINRGLGVATLMAVFCMGLHSMVDFNLHIPANALTFTVLLALVWALPEQRRRGEGQRIRKATSARDRA